MVKILSNGDIVPDDDPRAQGANSPGNRSGSGAPRPRQPMGFVQHTDYGQGGGGGGDGQGMYMGGQQVSIFDTLNQRLVNLGIPSFTVGQWTIRPIVLVGFVLATLVFGLPGLVFAGVLFVVAKISQPGQNPFEGWSQQANAGSTGNQPGGGGGGGGGGGRGSGFGGSGGGHRLGRS